ncbi:MAG: outer membrane beta-barrel protein [Candidatus Anammoxibacter sp.]
MMQAHWAGGVLTAIWTFTDWINLAARYEYADYTDEFNLNAWSATATLNVNITESLMIRPEYRHNGFTGKGSDIRPTFSSDPGRDSDDIFAIGFSYIF